MRKVLFIAYNFPPHGGAGVQRSTKFVRYLHDNGWEPIVLTSDEDACEIRDDSLISQIPQHVRVERVKAFSINRFIRRANKLKLRYPAKVVNAALGIPDAAHLWSRACRKRAMQIIQQEEVIAIYTTSAPYSTHLLGKWLKEQTGLPWLADFRDPWSANYLVPMLPGYRHLNRIMEKSVLLSADCIVSVSKPILDDFEKLVAPCNISLEEIPNGFDENEVFRLPKKEKSDVFRILYTGSFGLTRRPDSFIEALYELLNKQSIAAHEIEVTFVGQDMQKYIPTHPSLNALDYVNHRELHDLREASDALLLIIVDNPANLGTYTGKLFEYIALNRPIIAVAPKQGVATALIKNTKTGFVAGGESEDIQVALLKAIESWRSSWPDWQPDTKVIGNYSRQKQTERLASLLCSITKNRT